MRLKKITTRIGPHLQSRGWLTRDAESSHLNLDREESALDHLAFGDLLKQAKSDPALAAEFARLMREGHPLVEVLAGERKATNIPWHTSWPHSPDSPLAPSRNPADAGSLSSHVRGRSADRVD